MDELQQLYGERDKLREQYEDALDVEEEAASKAAHLAEQLDQIDIDISAAEEVTDATD